LAYDERWRFLYAIILQGELVDSKSKCYSPRVPEIKLRDTRVPKGVEVSRDGTRDAGTGCTGGLPQVLSRVCSEAGTRGSR